MASLKSLTDDELRQKLKEYGITSPVTASTRNILIKKLNHVIANQKKSGPVSHSLPKTTTKSNNNRLHSISSDEDEDFSNGESSSQYHRANRLSKSKRDSVRGGAIDPSPEIPLNDRNGAVANYNNSRSSSRQRSSSRLTSSILDIRDRSRGPKYRSDDDNGDSANSRMFSVNSYSGENSVSRKTRVSVGTYFPAVSSRLSISPRAKIPDEYDTCSDSDIGDSEDAVILSKRASSASGVPRSNVRDNSVTPGDNSHTARASYPNHKLGTSTIIPSDKQVKYAEVRNRKDGHSYVENGTRREDYGEERDRDINVAESVASQTTPGSRDLSTVANGRHHSERNSLLDASSQGDESTWHYSVPLLLLILLAVFFGVLAMLYVNMRTPLLPMLRSVPAVVYQSMAKLPVPFFTQPFTERKIDDDGPSSQTKYTAKPSPLSSTSGDILPICSGEDIKSNCFTLQELASLHPVLAQIDSVIIPALRQHAELFQCGNSPVRYLSVEELHSISNADSSQGIMTLGKLAELNSILGLRAERNDDKALLGIALASPPMYILCHITAAIYSFFYLVVGLITVCLAFFLTYYCVNYYRQKKDLENQQVYEMVEQILEVLSEVAGPGGKDHVAVNHIRDSLINPRERNAKRDIWKKAVMFINKYESRIRYEIENVHGEDCEIWRWTSGVPHSPSNSPGNDGSSNRPPAKMWQGQAFESLETTHNLPNVSPTSCLKIRNMFDCDVEFGDGWPSRIQDSILEKCEGISIVHIAVDRGSREGCVYLKCASLVEAGRAYRALHGWWYDGNLVTVKFLRDERYHQRFPIACHATRRLRPSNNKRLSLQVPGGQSDTVEHQ